MVVAPIVLNLIAKKVSLQTCPWSKFEKKILEFQLLEKYQHLNNLLYMCTFFFLNRKFAFMLIKLFIYLLNVRVAFIT